MAGINKVILIGNLGKDPEVRYLPNGTAVANITVATSETWKDKQTGESKEQTEWHRVTFFRRLAEIAGEYLRKGSKVYIEGKLQTRKWQDQSGNDRYSTDVIADQMQMLDSKGASGGYAPQQQNPQSFNNAPQQQNAQSFNNAPQQQNAQSFNNAPQQQQQNNNPQQGQAPQNAQAPAVDDGFLDEDIPF